MTTIGITGPGLTGVLRMTWVQDQLAHVINYSRTDETTGTWTGLACPAHGLSLAATWITRRSSAWPPRARSPT